MEVTISFADQTEADRVAIANKVRNLADAIETNGTATLTNTMIKALLNILVD